MGERIDRLRRHVQWYAETAIAGTSDELQDEDLRRSLQVDSTDQAWELAGDVGAQVMLGMSLEQAAQQGLLNEPVMDAIAEHGTTWLLGVQAGIRAATGEPSAFATLDPPAVGR